MSTVAWMSFDEDQQRRTYLLMRALSEAGTMDQLGFGLVRDLLAARLTPGVTSLMTRARYLLFVPWIYQELEGSSAGKLREFARKREGHLAWYLDRYAAAHPGNRETGIIGRLSGADARQPASATYWGMLLRLGIATGSSGALDYCRRLAEEKSARTQKSMMHGDETLVSDRATSLWSELPANPTPKFLEGDPAFTGFDLSLGEAEFLRERFVRAEQDIPDDRKSLIHAALTMHHWVEKPSPWLVPWPGLGAETSLLVELAMEFDWTTYGTRVMYNYLCSTMLPPDDERREALLEKYRDAMGEWLDEMVREPARQDWLSQLDRWVLAEVRNSAARRQRWTTLRRFVAQWEQLVLRRPKADELLAAPDAQELIRRRESVLKGSRSRLAAPGGIKDWEGESSYFHLDYNWATANRLITDIHRGLGTPTLSEGDR